VKKKILAVLILLVMLASIPVAVYLVKKRQEIQLRAAPATVLSLIPAAEAYDIGETFTVNIQINTGENLIVSADIILSYDPTILEAQSVTLGSFLPGATEINNLVNNDTGKITYSFYTMQENAQQGEGTIASVSFKGIAAGTSSVIFDESQSAIGGLDESQNVLVDTVLGSYLIAEPQATATVTPTPTVEGDENGVGGGEEPTATATTTPTPTEGDEEDEEEPTATPTPTTTEEATPTPTTAEELPEAGVPAPTLFLLIGGGILLVLSFFRLLLY
jgi:hypothetical protein